MYFTESIYDVLRVREAVPQKKYRYRSRLDPKYADNAIKSDKKLWATMGRAEYTPPNPQEYLRKHANSNRIQPPKPQIREKITLQKMPPLPKDRLKLLPRKKINYIKENIASLKNIKPKECEQKLVITRYGDTVNGKKLEPTHIYSKKFGTVPEYIHNTVRHLEYNMERRKDENDIETKIPACRYVTRRERAKILHGLKQNWDELSKQYQLLPIITDNVRRQLNKIEAETALEKLEKDILLMEKCPYIYVKS